MYETSRAERSMEHTKIKEWKIVVICGIRTHAMPGIPYYIIHRILLFWDLFLTRIIIWSLRGPLKYIIPLLKRGIG